MIKFVKGNEAVVIGALYAGAEAYFGYPITPASEVAHKAAEYFPAVGRIFVQGECEAAVSYMLYGAAAAGCRALTATSGPGFSLMQEGLSYMAATDIPTVIVDVMRAGPGLGNVYPEQADYTQVVKGGGHGSYRCVVLAPGNVQEMCDLTMLAFEKAFEFRTPAIVLADGQLGQMMEPLRLPKKEALPIDTTAWATQGTAETHRNLLTSIYLDAPAQEAMNLRLQEKYARMDASFQMAELYCCEDAEFVLMAFGSSARIVRSAVDELRKEGVKVGLFRPITLSPFPIDALRPLAGKRLWTVEMSAGQFRDDVILHLAKAGLPCGEIGLIHRMGGMLIPVKTIVETVRKEVK
ncbi:MAG: 3-methyl-2-oxobutanoate dehydrogenase subunit VorB [Kiritimatiellia bacterium]